MLPSGRVIVPSVPVTPDPAVAGPFTGGQKAAQDPVHLDVVVRTQELARRRLTSAGGPVSLPLQPI